MQGRLPRFWRAATLVWMAGILIASLLPGTVGAPGGTGWHLLGYGVLGVLWGQWQASWIVWLLATGYGAVIEGIQWLLPYRLAEGVDVLINALGVTIGLLLGHLVVRVTPSR